MISLLRRLFVDHWVRKLISLVLAIVIWFMLDQSEKSTKTISNVGVRVINLPEGKTISGLQSNGLLNKKVALTITGKKSVLEDLNANDFETVIDAAMKPSEWVTTITKKHLVSLNPELNIPIHVSKVASKNLIIKLVPLAKEKIPVYVTKPIGEPPRGYQFLDVWPYHLNLSISGPEETIKQLKSRGLKLTFNLSDVSASDLDNLQASHSHRDIISFPVPKEWKSLSLPTVSEKPLFIDDQESKYLRIDFIRSEMVPIKFAIPISLYIPPEHSHHINPQSLYISNSEIIETKRGIKVLSPPIFAKGVSSMFLNVIKDMMEISIILSSSDKHDGIHWSVHFVNPKLLEDRYVSTMMTDVFDEEIRSMHPRFREEYLRNRFRNYMNRLQLFTKDEKALDFGFEIRGKEVMIRDASQATTP